MNRGGGPAVEDSCPAVAGPDGAAREAKEPAVSKDADPLRAIATSFSDLTTHLRAMLQVRADQFRLAIRRKITAILIGLVGGVVALLLMVFAVAYLIHGTALGLAAACGGRLWLGYLLTGVLFLGGPALAGVVLLRRGRSAAARQLYAKYHASETATRECEHGGAGKVP
jgi:hypothetical protein